MKQNSLAPLLMMLFSLLLAAGAKPAAASVEIPYQAHILLNEVSQLMGRQQYPEAIKKLELFRQQASINSRRSKKNGNHHYLVTFALANCYLNVEQPEKAAGLYRSVLEAQPSYFPAWSNLGMAYYRIPAFGKAAEAFGQAYRIPGKQRKRMLYLSSASYLADQQPQKALEKMRVLKQQSTEPLTVQENEMRVHILFALDRKKEALPIIQEIVAAAVKKQKKRWQEILLHQYSELNMPDKALNLAERLAAEDPLESRWWKALTHLYLQEGHHRNSLLAITVLQKLRPLSLEEKKMAGSLSLALNLPGQSIGFNEAVAAEKTTKELVRALVHSYLKLGRDDLAVEWIETGLSLFDDPELLLLKANLHFEGEQYAAAGKSYQKLTTYPRHEGQGWLMLGYTAWKRGDYATAQRALIRAAEFPDQKPSALAVLKQLNTLNRQDPTNHYD